jgi:CRP/FNR family cyclic AMP-dependent transcriptional regulator
MRIVDDQTRSATVLSDGKTICLAVDTSAGNRLSTSEQKDERLDFYFCSTVFSPNTSQPGCA